MKRIISLAAVFLLCTGCGGKNREMERLLRFRQNLLQAQGCGFHVQITADYGDTLAEFGMDCRGDPAGNLTFQVTAPESVSGISGNLSEDGGRLTFDDTALFFSPVADGQLSPVSAGWILLKTLRGGCITSVCMEEERLRASVDDSYEDKALRLDIWLNEKDEPVQAEILWEGRRILSLTIQNFTLL